ncbi:MAG: hypothetical protein WCA20_33205 [Candidatus Sulfotelmatobacter sp.]
MATKKNARKSSTKSKKTARKKPTPLKKVKGSKKLAKNKPVAKRAEKNKASGKRQTRKKSERLSALASPPESPSGEQSGDLQGLSHLEVADSESVDELLEEGNAFEADVVAGVESAEDADEKEVRTHEVPEDDVPGEYLDEK